MKGAILKVTENVANPIINFLENGLDKKCFDAVLIPVKVPVGNSFAWVLIQNKSLLEDANPLPPVMPVQGAKALSSITRMGKTNKKIAAIMRPCEVRAAIELSKLEQVKLENIFLISIDCPGVLPLKDYLESPEEATDKFNEILLGACPERSRRAQNDIEWGNESTRPACQVCDKFVGTDLGFCQSDLHIGILGTKDKNIFLIPNNEKGKSILNKMDIEAEKSMDNWEKKAKEIIEVRKKKKKEVQERLKSKVMGIDNLLDVFSDCINCHNCRSACPICYCRQCYFESEKMKLPSDDYLMRAESKGALRFLPDTLLFHLGRMTHMSLSCVGCGACEDACPMSIEVAQIFSFVGERSQGLFSYIPGKNAEEPLSLRIYKEDEFHEVET
ncbi:Coenzyme F420 hydrogenase/dehydrogenase, beta subunit C-terminal domain [candidate division WOR-3 bacterium]|nr:Coenzyme F420 hydrogenase/dehydrogenase, beta subunit C-terminal domain [candidate division WOR-3 bacterium]